MKRPFSLLALLAACTAAAPVRGSDDESWRGYFGPDDETTVLGVSGESAKNPTPPPVEEKPAGDVFDRISFDYETGVLVRASDHTFLNYTIVPQIFTVRTPAHLAIDLGKAGTLTLRSRFSLLVEPIVKGPEDIYLGISGSPSIEWWSPSRQWAVYGSVGGGVGWINSQDVLGGQGQDFTLNWFATVGVRFYFAPDCAVSVGAMFQHWSNGGMSDPNYGLDQLGPMVGFSWAF